MKNTSQETDDFRAELDRATHAIKGLRENLALLTTTLARTIDKANEQARENSESAAKLARSLNVITGCLVGVGIIQIFVSLVCLWHR
jgi:ABC-type transporter Mla subunit MlaD